MSPSSLILRLKEEDPASSYSVCEAQGQNLWLPVGYRFCPRDCELVIHYLKNKILGLQLPADIIREVDLYSYNPDELPLCEVVNGKTKEAYFFTYTDRKYPNGKRPSRTTRDGYWKATGGDKNVLDDSGAILGFKKVLVFYWGKAPNGTKTSWVMHEYRINPNILSLREANAIGIRNCVVCRIQEKEDGPRRTQRRKDKGEENMEGMGESTAETMSYETPLGFYDPAMEYDYDLTFADL